MTEAMKDEALLIDERLSLYRRDALAHASGLEAKLKLQRLFDEQDAKKEAYELGAEAPGAGITALMGGRPL